MICSNYSLTTKQQYHDKTSFLKGTIGELLLLVKKIGLHDTVVVDLLWDLLDGRAVFLVEVAKAGR
jgi:hypothetical protein